MGFLTGEAGQGSVSCMESPPFDSDSHAASGGEIPGGDGAPAFTLHWRRPSTVPILVAVPHAGRTYPKPLLARMRHGGAANVRLEDRHVDLIAHRVAQETGANLLVAHAPRAMIDLNRAPDDVDWEMISMGVGRSAFSPARITSQRVRSGLGLVPRRLAGLGELWRQRLESSELQARIENVHVPYHTALEQELEALRARWGAALLIDLHSMPPLPRKGGRAAAEIVVGDRFGASCAGSLVAETFAYLGRVGRLAAHNRPYAGGYVLDRHASPLTGIHAMQLEIDRTCYLDEALAEPEEGLEAMAADIAGLVRLLAVSVSELGRNRQAGDWPEAAE